MLVTSDANTQAQYHNDISFENQKIQYQKISHLSNSEYANTSVKQFFKHLSHKDIQLSGRESSNAYVQVENEKEYSVKHTQISRHGSEDRQIQM